jgi:DNA mismatch endonuclease, patch repair protein
LKPYQQDTIQVPRFSEANGFYTTRERSGLMSRIKAQNTKPEIKLRKVLWALGLRYRKNVKSLPGKPDIVLRKYKLVIFIDGEFWHGSNWKEKKEKIKSNRDFWIPKIERNIQRDREVNEQLNALGYTVIRFWEQQVKKDLNWCINLVLEKVSYALNEEDFYNPSY